MQTNVQNCKRSLVAFQQEESCLTVKSLAEKLILDKSNEQSGHQKV